MSLKRIINVPTRKIGKTTMDAVSAMAMREGTSIFKALQKNRDEIKQNLLDFVTLMENISEKKNILSPDEFVNYVYEESGYRAYLEHDEKAQERQENVGELVSGAKMYADSAENPNFDDYMDNIALVSDIDNYDEELDACTLMTMHASKGLEFPVVFILGADEGIFPSFMSVGDESEMEEERRLCYVAITRAKKKLYITGACSRTVYGKTAPYSKSQFIGEIPRSVTEYSERTPYSQSFYGDSFEDTGYVLHKTHEKKKTEIEKTTLMPEKKAEPSGNLSFRVGDRVVHKKFGGGLITAAEPVGNDVHYEIVFDSVGTKRMLGLYAKLKKE